MKPPRRCPVCGREIVRHSGVADKDFRRRKTCGRVCGAARRRAQSDERTAAAAAKRAAETANAWVDQLPETQAGLSGQCFARHEIRFRPQPGRLPAQPATAVLGGSALDGDV